MCESMTAEDFVAKQIGEVQDKIRPFVRCACWAKLELIEAYKCLYCKVWFCESCAEQHFGKTVAEYKKQKADALVMPKDCADLGDGGAEGEFFAEGVFAAQRGDELEHDNPYDSNDPEHNDWRAGWEYGAEALGED